ncbi:serine hydrolase domain-containing protein [Streptomyces olivoreticuli]
MRLNTCGRRSAAVVGAVTAAVLALPASAQAAPAGDHAATKAVLSAYQAESGPGAGLYAGDGKGTWSLSVGTGAVNATQPIQPADRFRIGSQTKAFTASVVMQLVDEGKVSLGAPIEQYLPGVVASNGHDGNAITIRQLLQHTSGIPTNDKPQAKANPDGTYALAEVVRDGLRLPSASKPGVEFHYSNTNYQILSMLVERVTGAPLSKAVTDRIIEPLGLTRTIYPLAGDRSLATPYVHGYNGGRLGPFFFWTDVTPNFEPSQYSGAGAIISTQQDLTTFYQALIGGKVVSAASLAEMQTTFHAGPGFDFGLGLTSRALSCGGTAWGISGSVLGYTSLTMVTADGRHATAVTNATSPSLKVFDAVDSALCE